MMTSRPARKGHRVAVRNEHTSIPPTEAMTDPFVFLDIVNKNRVSGWCLNGDDINIPVRLLFYADDEKIGETRADRPRPDLKDLNFHPTGHCGFDFSIPPAIDISKYDCFYIRAPGARNHLQKMSIEELPDVLTEDEANRVLFMHIPKTGGTSFNTFVRNHFPEGSTVIHMEDIDPDDQRALAQQKIYLAGHLPLRLIKERFDLSRFDLITMLRDPYRQLHSHVSWVKNIGADPGSDYFQKHHELFQDLALRLNRTDFSIVDDLPSLTRDLPANLCSLFDNNQTRHFLETEPAAVTEAHLFAAIDNLDCFKLVGTTEKYDEFTAAFCSLYDIGSPARGERFNESRSQRLFDCDDPSARSRLLPLVQYDLRLYEFVANGMPCKD